MRIVLRLAAIACCLVACENSGIGAREKGALAGAALGAGLGAIVGNQAGHHAGAGVAIGSGFGALAGGLIGNSIDNDDQRRAETDQQISARDRELEENRRLIEELRNRGADARGTDRGIVVNLPDVLFDFNSSELTPPARDTAYEIASVLEDAGNRRISVEGHTDSVGSDSYNKRLSESRAQSVADELVRNGVPRGAIVTKGYGEKEPIASNETDSGRQRNRRVEVVISNREQR